MKLTDLIEERQKAERDKYRAYGLKVSTQGDGTEELITVSIKRPICSTEDLSGKTEI